MLSCSMETEKQKQKKKSSRNIVSWILFVLIITSAIIRPNLLFLWLVVAFFVLLIRSICALMRSIFALILALFHKKEAHEI